MARFRPSRLAATLALALLAAPGSGQVVDAGEPAPDFGGTWFNHDDAQLSDFLGRIVYIEFWGSFLSDDDRDRVTQVKRLAREHGEKGLVVVVISQAETEDIEERIAEWWIDFPVVYLGDDADSLEAKYGVNSSYPRAALVDHEGKLNWRGSSFQLDPDRIDKLVKKASIIPLLPDEHEKINDYLRFTGNLHLGKAHKAIARALSKADGDEPLTEAFERLERLASGELGRIEALIEDADYGVADAALATMSEAWAGSEPANKARGRKTELARDKDAKLDIRAYRTFLKGEDFFRFKRFDEAKKEYDKVIRAFDGTKCAERSRQRLAEMRRR